VSTVSAPRMSGLGDAHRHDCPITPGVAVRRNTTHGEYDELWVRSLGKRNAAEWRAPRDSQRARVYRAEHAVALQLGEPNLGAVADTQAAVDRVVGSEWWHTAAPHRPVVVVGDGRGRRSGGSVGGEIRLPRLYRTRLVLLHELAHEWLTCPVRAPHGPEFAGAFLVLAGSFHSESARDRLAAAFADEGVSATE